MTRVTPREPAVSTDKPSVIRQVVERVAERVTKFVVLEVHANLVAPPQEGGTPVKTGFARACWIPSVGQPSDRVAGTPESVSSAPAEQGVGQILTYRLSQGLAFVTSNCSYILALYAGHSQQAPAGFVDGCVARGVASTEKAFGGGL